jgi:hypothetical protein
MHVYVTVWSLSLIYLISSRLPRKNCCSVHSEANDIFTTTFRWGLAQHTLLSAEHWGLFLHRQNHLHTLLTTHLHVMRKETLHGAIPPCRQTLENFTFHLVASNGLILLNKRGSWVDMELACLRNVASGICLRVRSTYGRSFTHVSMPELSLSQVMRLFTLAGTDRSQKTGFSRTNRQISCSGRSMLAWHSYGVVVFKKNGVFWDVMPCGSSKNRRFGGT